MRRCKFIVKRFTNDTATPYVRKQVSEEFEGVFHQWMQESYAGDTSVVGVVELPDGSIQTPYAGNITFIKDTI